MATTRPMLDERSLVALLGEPRATIVRLLKTHGERTAPELSEDLGISDVAVRRHLAQLDRDGMITERTVNQGRGRPVARYRLTARAESLFPHRYVEVIDDLLDYLDESDGGGGVPAFLRWRQEREADDYRSRVTASDVGARIEQLAEALSDAGYEASVTRQDDGYVLTQTHCAIYEVAKQHPQLCAHEAAMFRRVLGDGVRVSRRRTLANGDGACVCTVTSCCEPPHTTSGAVAEDQT